MSQKSEQNTPLVFRIKPTNAWNGLLVLILMGGAGSILTYTMLTSESPFTCGRLLLCLGVLCIPTFFVLLGLYVIADYCKKRLTITADEVVMQGVFGTTHFRFDEVSSIDWGKSIRWITVKFRDKKLRVHFVEYREDDLDRIAYLFRTRVPEERQKHWDWLCYAYARPSQVRDAEHGPPPDPSKGEVLTTRRRYDRLFFITAALLTILALILFFGFGFEAKTSFPLILISCIWLAMRFSIPKKGHVEPCIVRRSQQNKELGSLLLKMAPALVLMALSLIFQKFQILLLIAAFLAMMVAAFFDDRERNRRQAEEIKRFAEEGNLRPDRIFRWVDEDEKHKVELD